MSEMQLPFVGSFLPRLEQCLPSGSTISPTTRSKSRRVSDSALRSEFRG